MASGSGTILEAIVAAGLPVSLVLVDRPCRAREVAERLSVPCVLVDRADYGGFGPNFDRDGFTKAVAAALEEGSIDVAVMAGFGTVLTEPVHRAAGVTVTGTTVHIATVEMDAGPILARAEVPVLPGDTEDTLHERIKAVERTLYPETIRRFLDGLAAPVGDASGSPTEVAP
jgi:phosphoribosylglycinamide formyltransferase-1